MSRRGLQVTIASGAVVMAALVVAAVSQPLSLLSRPVEDLPTIPRLPTVTTPAPPEPVPSLTLTPSAVPFEPSPLLVALVQVVLVLAAVVVLAVLVQLVRSLLNRRPHVEL